MKKLFVSLMMLCVMVTPAWADLEKFSLMTLQDAAVATGNGQELPVDQYTTVGLQVTIETTATITFEATADGTTYVSAVCSSVADTSGALVSTATASGVYQCNVAGMAKFRARISAWTSGAVTVIARASTAVVRKGGGGSGLPAGGDLNDCLLNTAPGTGDWQACPGAGGGDDVSVNGAAAVNPDFTTTGSDLTLVNTANVITFLLKSGLTVTNWTFVNPALGTPASGVATNLTGTAAGLTAGAASALAANPTDCSATQFATAIAANGNLTCAALTDADIPDTITVDLATTATTANSGDSATSFFSSGTIEDARLPTSMADKVFTGSMLIPNDTAVPGTCSIGMLFFDNNATAGVNLYGCTASNTWTLLGDGGGAGSVATDTIWDAAGDLVQGTGSNTAARLAIGTASQLLQVNSGATGVEWTSALTSLTSIAFGSDPADAGRLRLSNNEAICWEAATPGTDLCLTLNASDEFELNAPLNLTGTAGAMLLTAVESPSAPSGAEQWYFYADPDDNLPKYIYNGGSEVTFHTTANPQTTVSGNAGTATALAANGGNCSAGSYPLGVDASGAVESCTSTASETVAFTNKTLNCSSGSGNVCTIWERRAGDLVGLADASTVGHIWDFDPLSTTCTPAAITGTNQSYGVCTFPDSDGEFGRQLEFDVPTGGIASMNADIWWKTTGTGNARFRIQTLCYASDAAGDSAYSNSTYVTAAAGTSGRLVRVNMPTITITGCDANERMAIRFSRNRTEGSDTLNAALDVRRVFLNIEVAQ